jgi:NADP-dependent 3-hydroxy acid dehydrogenase YdfG
MNQNQFSLSRKIALVTVASSGISVFIAKDLGT